MKPAFITAIASLVGLGSLLIFASPGPGSGNDFVGKRVLVIGIDGLRPDALQAAISSGQAPNLKQLVDTGIVTWNAYAGGNVATTTQQATMSGPGWSSISTGTWIDRHGVNDNGTVLPYDTAGAYNVTQAPHFAKRLRESKPTAQVDIISSWNWIEDYLVAAQPSEFAYHAKGIGANYAGRDGDVKDKAVARLGSSDPDVLQLHFDQVDGAGHATGFSTGNPDYMTAIANVDSHIGAVLAAINARPQRNAEEWNILVTTDHGGTGNSHGGQSAAERTIFVIGSGPAFPSGVVSKATVGHNCIPPTALKVLGVNVDPAWQMSGEVFGVAPFVEVRGAGVQALISIIQPSSGSVSGCTGIEIWRDGSLVTSIAPSAVAFTDNPPVPPTGSQTFQYELRFTGTTEVRTGSAVLSTGVAATPNINQDLVVDLPFDGNGDDISGRANHGTLVGTGGFTTGRTGQAIVVNASQYVTLGTPTDLQFGADTDFTVAFWAKSGGGWAADPAIISNKNWNSGNNTGWIVATQQAGPNWQWNLKGAVGTRRDYDPTSVVINDNTWHHICVAHTRTGNAQFYYDGKLIGTVAISGAGTVDSGLPVNIGRDGAGGNILSVDMALDDVKIWRRALTAADLTILVPPPPASPPDVTSDLVLDLPFDSSTLDVSGRNNHGTLTGGTDFAAGRNGQAVVINAAQYVTLGTPSDLKFGSTVPFTISMWVKNLASWAGDPSLISNKNWLSGGNQGWFLGAQQDATTWQWNFKGASLARRDFDAGGIMNDGAWHHIAVSHDRLGNASFYHDGVLLGTVAIGGSGDVDTVNPINIGRDGLAASAGLNCLIDDVKIWRRALRASDLNLIYPSVPAGWAAWRMATFNAAQRDDLLISGPNADPDGDGMTNLEEYAFGTAGLTPNPQLISWNEAQKALLFPEFHDGTGVPGRGYLANGVRYQIQSSTDLSSPNWSPLPLSAPAATLLPRNDSTRYTTQPLSIDPATTPRQFYRLKLDLVP